MEILNTIFAIAAGVFGAGWGMQFIHYKQEKRKREAEARNSELDVGAKEDAIRDAKLKQAYERIVQLQDIADKERDKWAALAVELSGLKFELLREKEARALAEMNICSVVGCENRCPSRVSKQ